MWYIHYWNLYRRFRVFTENEGYGNVRYVSSLSDHLFSSL